MMYPFMTLNDNTEITHSEMKPDGSVKAGFLSISGKFTATLRLR